MTRAERTTSAAPADEVADVARILEEEYGSPRLGNPSDPLDVLYYILLSNRTSPNVAIQTYRNLRATWHPWSQLLQAKQEELESLLAPAGLWRKRAAQIIGIAQELHETKGGVSLDFLETLTNAEAEGFLTGLPGVSLKVAKCVLLYGLDRGVLPVDVHVHRVTKRLGWQAHTRPDQSHDTLEDLVAPDLRYGIHVNLIAHGRAVCHATDPDCASCTIRGWCQFAGSVTNGKRED